MDLYDIERYKNAAANGRLIVALALAVMVFDLSSHPSDPRWPLLLPLGSLCAAWLSDVLGNRFLSYVCIVLAAASIGVAGYMLAGG